VARCSAAGPRFLLFLWVAAVSINLAATAVVTGFHRLEPGSDETGYYALAQQILHGFHFDGLFRTPVYPALLAAVFAVTGPSVAAGKVFNCVLGGFTPVGVYCLCYLLFDARKAVVAGVLAALLPTVFSVNGTLYSETLSTLLFVWVNVLLVLVVRRVDSDEPGSIRAVWWHWLGIGAALGLLAFAKPQHIFYLPLLAIAGLWHFWHDRVRYTGMCAVAAIGFCLVLSPWWARNWVVTGGHFVPLTTSGGRALVDTNNPTIAHMSRYVDVGGRMTWEGAGKFTMHLEDNALVDQARLQAMTELEQDRYFRQQALHWIAAHPGDWAVLCVRKLAYGFSLWPLWTGSSASLLMSLSFLAILVPSLPGWFLIARRPGLHRLLLVHLATYIAVTVIFFGSWRYRNPFEGSFIIAAVVGACMLLPGKRFGQPPPTSSEPRPGESPLPVVAPLSYLARPFRIPEKLDHPCSHGLRGVRGHQESGFAIANHRRVITARGRGDNRFPQGHV
jgi:4-amino-4-deoxy-L-arabinose transferase-like glycosyltransferase